MLKKEISYKRFNGGLHQNKVTKYILFGFITVYKIVEQVL